MSEAELRRDASELLEEYMTSHNIKFDGQVIDDSGEEAPRNGRRGSRITQRSIVGGFVGLTVAAGRLNLQSPQQSTVT